MKKVQVELIETFRKFFDVEVEDDADDSVVIERAVELANDGVIDVTGDPDGFDRRVEVYENDYEDQKVTGNSERAW